MFTHVIDTWHAKDFHIEVHRTSLLKILLESQVPYYRPKRQQ